MSEFNTITSNDEGLALFHCEENYLPAENQVFGPVERSLYIIECCTGGFGYIAINDREFRIKEGDCYVLMPRDKVTHKTTSESYRSELSCFVRGFELKRALKRAGITSESPFAPPTAYPVVCDAIKRIISLDGDHSISADYLKMSEIYKIMSALVHGKNRTESANIINKAIGIMDANYDKPLSVDDIARHVGLERSYFSVLFREYTELSPHAYLNGIRIKRACTLMTDTDLSLTEIALRVGLDPTGFSRMFKREMGISPSEYRKVTI